MKEATYGVWLRDRLVGKLVQRQDYTTFRLLEDYVDDGDREILGLVFEDDLYAEHTGQLRLPRWFSNLLPEGILRQWIADERGVSADREMELLAQVGHDLPGAVQVLPIDEEPSAIVEMPSIFERSSEEPEGVPAWRFSLAGVALKFSMLTVNDKLTLPAYGQLGDSIVKLPDRTYQEVPRNEFTMMSMASAVGISVPEVKLVHRDELPDLPDVAWPGAEEWAYAIRRFDRDGSRHPIHIEDLAQVKNSYAGDKYLGNYETIGSYIFREHDLPALAEFARRLAFITLIANGDAHLKNWSLIYRDPRIPTLAPAYDLVSTASYRPDAGPEELALRFNGSKRLEDVSIFGFKRLERKLDVPEGFLAEVVARLVADVVAEWPRFRGHLEKLPRVAGDLDANIEERSRSLLRGL